MSESSSKLMFLRFILRQIESGRFLPAGDVDLETGLGKRRGQLGDDPIDQIVVVLPQLAEAIENGFPGIGPKGREGEIVELVLHRLHADALGQRRVDLLGLARDPPPFLRLFDELQGAHVVQAVGELDHQHPDVVGHREQ